jgi:AAA domain
LLHSIPKWGKTSLACYAKDPVFLMSKGEDGLLTLIVNGLVPAETAHFPECFGDWVGFKKALMGLANEEHSFKTLVLDTVNGFERLCHEHICQAEFEGKWDKFTDWGKGPKVSLAEWSSLTGLLDGCRKKGMGIFLLCHSSVRTFANPEGPNYDRWEPTLSKEAWAHLDRWCDMILFGTHETVTPGKENQKSKAKGGTERVIHTERCAAFDAGNRVGLPSSIECGSSAKEAWDNFREALSKKGEG